MEDKHNVILILLSSCGLIFPFRRLIISSHSRFKVFSSFLFRSSKLLADFVSYLHLNHRKNLILSLSSFKILSRHSFVTGVHQGGSSWFNSFSQVFIKILSKELKYLSFLLFEVQLNSPYSFEVEFCISSFFSAIQSFPFVAGYHLMILRCYL